MADPISDQNTLKPPAAPPVVVKKYANRRLYNTETSSYITLENLAEMVRQGRDFIVYDAKSGDDITRGVLTQIIVEEEGKGRSLLPTTFLRQLIGFYGDQMQAFVPRYLEQSMEVLAQQQESMRDAVQKTMGTLFPFGNAAAMGEMSRQNMAMMERALSLFSPFYRAPEDKSETEALRAQLADALKLSGERTALQNELATERRQHEAEAMRLRAELEDQRKKLDAAAEREAALRAELEALRKRPPATPERVGSERVGKPGK